MTCALALALALAATAAHADPRVRTLAYEQSHVFSLAGRSGYQSMIRFAPDEQIQNVAVGDSAGWQVTPNKRADMLFVKPLGPRAKTNMTVVTDKRTYMFDLLPAGGGAAVYALDFRYRDVPVERAEAPRPEPTAVAARQPEALGLNFAWDGKGARQLLPLRAFDDGASVFLAWDPKVQTPAILAIGPDGGEGPVNYSVKGQYVVVDQVPAMLVLRTGRASATLTNLRPLATPAADRSTQTAER